MNTQALKDSVENWILQHVGDSEYGDRENDPNDPDFDRLCVGASKQFGIPSDTDWLEAMVGDIIDNLRADADADADEEDEEDDGGEAHGNDEVQFEDEEEEDEAHLATLAFGIDGGGYAFTNGVPWKGRTTVFEGWVCWEDPNWEDLGMQDLDAIKALDGRSAVVVLDPTGYLPSANEVPDARKVRNLTTGEVEGEWLFVSAFPWNAQVDCFACQGEPEEGHDPEAVCGRCHGEQHWWEGSVWLYTFQPAE